MRSLPIVAAGLLLAALSLPMTACEDEDSEIGTPCESEEDCSEELICDVHDGQGTCQRDHDHQVPAEDDAVGRAVVDG